MLNFRSLVALAVSLAVMLSTPAAMAGDTVFTYQGSLMESGSPVTGTADIDVSLWNALVAG